MSLIDRAEARRKPVLAAVRPSDQGGSSAGLLYAFCFPDPAVMRNFLADQAGATKVWRASDPAHMIHLNWDEFLGPHAGEAS